MNVKKQKVDKKAKYERLTTENRPRKPEKYVTSKFCRRTTAN